jgi:hypothetical protein
MLQVWEIRSLSRAVQIYHQAQEVGQLGGKARDEVFLNAELGIFHYINRN